MAPQQLQEVQRQSNKLTPKFLQIPTHLQVLFNPYLVHNLDSIAEVIPFPLSVSHLGLYEIIIICSGSTFINTYIFSIHLKMREQPNMKKTSRVPKSSKCSPPPAPKNEVPKD